MRSTSPISLVWAMALGLAACDSGDDSKAAGDGNDDAGGDGSADMGEVEFRFTVGSNVRTSSNLVDPLQGYVYGAIFKSSDVTVMGPRDGAEQLDAIVVEGADLAEAEITAPMWTSMPLPPGSYTFLGFFDVDASSLGAAEQDPEDGDPVTLPSANTFEVVAGETATVDIRFDLVL